MKPREKILKYGAENLKGYELVAIILGSGIKGLNVFNLSRKVNIAIKEKREDISVEDLEKIKGIGKIKAIQIVSAFELAKRYFVKDYIFINSTNDVLNQVGNYRNKKREYLICITLDGANRMINKKIITIGLLDQSLIHPREIFSGAIEDRANSIILIHNHPSGTNYPSNSDIKNTVRIKEVSKLVGIKLLDHIIITNNDYFSFVESNFL